MREEKTIKSNLVFEGKMINLRVDTVQLPGEKYATREIVDHPGAVAVVPINNQGKIVMVKQYRKAFEKFLLEIPAGKLEKNEEPSLCAKRELQEETGFMAKNINHLLTMYSTPGFSNEVIHVFLARDLQEGSANPDEDEYISVESFSLGELLKMIFNGTIKDSKTIAGILAAKEFLNNMDK